MNLTREKTRPLLALGPGVLPDVRFAPKVVACTPLTVGTKNKAVTPAPAGPARVRTLHCLQMSNALHVPFDAATARTAEGTRSPAYPRLVIATTIMASSLAFIDGSVVNVGLPAIVGAFMRTPSACSGWSIWRRIVLWAIAVAEAADLDAFGYLNGRIAHLERRIATLESSDR